MQLGGLLLLTGKYEIAEKVWLKTEQLGNPKLLSGVIICSLFTKTSYEVDSYNQHSIAECMIRWFSDLQSFRRTYLEFDIKPILKLVKVLYPHLYQQITIINKGNYVSI